MIYSCYKENTSPSTNDSFDNLEVKSRADGKTNYVIWQIKNKPFTVIFTKDGSNNDIWIIQSNANFNNESIVHAYGSLGFYNNSYLKLSFDNQVKVYSLADNLYQKFPANAVGLIKIIDDSLLNSLRNPIDVIKDDVIDDISSRAFCKKDGTSAKECKCAGGESATSCECGGSIAGISWHEQTSCSQGYYACCTGL